MYATATHILFPFHQINQNPAMPAHMYLKHREEDRTTTVSNTGLDVVCVNVLVGRYVSTRLEITKVPMNFARVQTGDRTEQ